MNTKDVVLSGLLGLLLALPPVIGGRAEDMGPEDGGDGGGMQVEIRGGRVTVRNVPGLSGLPGGGDSAQLAAGDGEDGLPSRGVAVINGEVWIDGEKVPPNVRHFTSKAGHSYAIDRSNGGTRVTSE